MITNRKRLRSDDSTPVLFRLPNLRSRDSSPIDAATDSTSAINLAGNTLRVDAPVFSPSEQPYLTPPVAISQPASGDVATSAASQQEGALPKGRGWIERIGSRTILLVTLTVIALAVWLTGQRMPASKPDVWQATASTPDEVKKTFDAGNSDQRVANTISEPGSLPMQPSAVPTSPLKELALLEPSAGTQVGAKPAIDTSATLTAPANRAFPTQPLPTSVYKANIDTDPLSATNDVSSVFGMKTLEASELPERGSENVQSVQPFYQGDSVTSLNGDNNLPVPQTDASQTVSTATPNPPVLEPNTLLNWLDEQSAARESRISATPNPVVDWSLYLPGADQTVRAASATQPTSNTMTTQQAGFPNGVTVNPYSR